MRASRAATFGRFELGCRVVSVDVIDALFDRHGSDDAFREYHAIVDAGAPQL
jgi:hypothetical protein